MQQPAKLDLGEESVWEGLGSVIVDTRWLREKIITMIMIMMMMIILAELYSGVENKRKQDKVGRVAGGLEVGKRSGWTDILRRCKGRVDRRGSANYVPLAGLDHASPRKLVAPPSPDCMWRTSACFRHMFFLTSTS
jgi:hypothetical protein